MRELFALMTNIMLINEEHREAGHHGQMNRPLHKEQETCMLQAEETRLDASQVMENPLLATKFFMPVAPGTLISRPRLTALLQQSLKHPLTLLSAPAGFGKTTLL